MSNVTFDFTNKNFIVTGASSGMGKQVVIELADAGAKVLALARRDALLNELADRFPNQVFPCACDVTDGEALEQVISKFAKEQGKIDGAIHAAGISAMTPLKAFDETQAKQIFDISFWGAVYLLKSSTKVSVSNKGASFILFSSVSASHGEPGLFAYSGSKAAMRNLVKVVCKEVAKRGLRVNTISPGWVVSDMTNAMLETNNMDELAKQHVLGFGNAEDVTGMILFLLSDRARWITGTDVVVDGGYLA